MSWRGNARSKYGAKRTTVDGVQFASQKEALRYGELKLLEKAGEIIDLRCQVSYDLFVHEHTVRARLRVAAARLQRRSDPTSVVKIGKYVADFVYQQKTLSASENDHYRRVVEDVKGFRTPLYRWKKKHFEAQYGITITEI